MVVVDLDEAAARTSTHSHFLISSLSFHVDERHRMEEATQPEPVEPAAHGPQSGSTPPEVDGSRSTIIGESSSLDLSRERDECEVVLFDIAENEI